ncbi:MAG: hypothetical protein QM734_12895 [Cyclobacteriaceae bacterium]
MGTSDGGNSSGDFFSGTQADNGNFVAYNLYNCPYLSFYYFVPSEWPVNLYFNSGVIANYLGGPKTLTSDFLNPSTNEDLTLSSHFRPFYLSGFIETGISINTYNNLNVLLGLRYYLAGQVITGDYKDIQNGSVAHSDQVETKGNYLSLSLKVGGCFALWKHRNFRHPRRRRLKHLAPIPKDKGKNTRGF